MLEPVINIKNYALNPHAAPLFITAFAILLLGAFTLLREKNSRAALPLSALITTLLLWVFAYGWMYSSIEPATAMWWSHFAHIGIIAIPAAAYHFSVVVVDRYHELKTWVWTTWVMSCALIALSLGTDWFLSQPQRYPWSYHPRYAPLGLGYIALLIVVWFRCTRLYWQAYREATPGSHAQKRAKYLGLIFAASVLGAADFAPALGIAVIPRGYLGVSFLAALLAYVTWRYRLIDITPAFAAQKIIETINDGLVVMDTDGIVRLANQTAHGLLGYDNKPLLGENLRQPLGLAGDTLTTLMNGEALSHYETAYTQPGGAELHLGISASIMRERDGTPAAFVCVLRDITEHKRAAEQIHQLAYFDGLTQLPNREHFHQGLEKILAAARNNGQQAALLFIDLDHFKRINDSLGHAVGDQLLHAAAGRIRQSVRDTSHDGASRGNETLVARLGGDEFVVAIYPITRADDADQIAERLLNVLSHPFRLQEHDIFVGASIGISLFPRDGDDSDTLLKYADTAMYEAKGAGRGHYQIYEQRMSASTQQHYALESGLRAALERDELILHYQPQFDLRQQNPVGVEALLRWRHPRQGLLSAEAFMSSAEESGLIVPLGEWVLRGACRQAKHWQDAGRRDLRLAVNIATRQLRHPGFAAALETLLHETGLPANTLTLELSEAALGQDEASAAAHCHTLSELGVNLIIDNFGGGHASLRQLTQLPISGLKIGHGFLGGAAFTSSDAAITSAIIALARNLSLEVMAEGVENTAQLTFLREHQCYRVQGRLLASAAPAAEIDLSRAWRVNAGVE